MAKHVITEVHDRATYDAVRALSSVALRGKLRAKDAEQMDDGRWCYFLGGDWIDERLLSPDLRPWRNFVETKPYENGKPVNLTGTGEVFLANSHYLVFSRAMEATVPGEPDALHLSLRTVENDTRHDWRELQRVKNELAGEDWEAVEIYPATSRLVDKANQYHLWCFPFILPFGFNTSLVTDTGTIEQMGGKQRQFTNDDLIPANAPTFNPASRPANDPEETA